MGKRIMSKLLILQEGYVYCINKLFVVQERLQKMKTNEGRLEEDKKALRCSLDDAENRVTKGELARRSLEGDLQRMRLALNDKETENQVCADVIVCSCTHVASIMHCTSA